MTVPTASPAPGTAIPCFPEGLFPCRGASDPCRSRPRAHLCHGCAQVPGAQGYCRAGRAGGCQVFVCFPPFLLLTLQEQYVHAGTCIQMSPCGWQLNHASPPIFSSNAAPADIELRAFIITCAGIFLCPCLCSHSQAPPSRLPCY